MILLVGWNWCVHMQTSIGELHLWIHPCFTSPTRLAILSWMVFKMRSKRPNNFYFVECCFQNLFKTACSILCSSHLAFFPIISLEFKLCNYTVVLTQLQLGKIPIYQRNYFSLCQQRITIILLLNRKRNMFNISFLTDYWPLLF